MREEVKVEYDDDEANSAPPAFWQASVNVSKAGDLAELTTNHEAVNGLDQVHWRNAINAELDSILL